MTKEKKKNAVRIFWVFFSSFSSSTISRLYSQFILPFDMSPYKATCLWKYVKQPKVREKLMIRDNIQQTCMRFNRFYFGSFVFFFFFHRRTFFPRTKVVDIVKMSFARYHTYESNEEKKNVARHSMDCRWEQNRSHHVYNVHDTRMFEIELPSGFQCGNRMMDTFGNELWTCHTR